MDKRIAQMSNHIIICGAGHNGKSVAEEFYRTGTPFVVVEKSPEYLESVLQVGDIPFVLGDATNDAALIAAGIERAKGLVTSLSDDTDNAFVVLSAKSLNPNLRIIARSIEESHAHKLVKAGADDVISPNQIGGLRMASMMIRPSVVRFLDAMLKDKTSTIRFEEVRVGEIRSLVSKTLTESEIEKKTGLLVLALMHKDGSYVFNPESTTMLAEDDTLMVMGESANINKLRA